MITTYDRDPILTAQERVATEREEAAQAPKPVAPKQETPKAVDEK
jgi:hypothetical protein